MLSSRNLLLVAHIGAAIVFLGPLTVATSLFPRYLRQGADDPAGLGAARAFHRISRAYGTTSLVVPVLGLALAGQGGLLGEPWVLASLAIFAVLAAVVLGVVVPEQRRLLAEGPAPAGLARLQMASGLVSVAWLAILALMVLKPS